MQFYADLHIHSKYSRAVSPKMELENFTKYGKIKGINIMTASDFTHPKWIKEIKTKLKKTRPGIYQLNKNSPYFILTTEISLIYNKHKIHLIVFAPNLKTVLEINKAFKKNDFNLNSDGRPILGISAIKFTEILEKVNPEIFIIPAHIWTPWFSLFGSRSGFSSLKKCFGKYSEKITAIETGLSSDPEMNWQIKELDSRIIASFSDAHSLKNLGRELTVFELPKNFVFQNIINAFKTKYNKKLKQSYIKSTIEFYPEEGKYHFSGHRKCNIYQKPGTSFKHGTSCPVCGKKLTLGVAHQVEILSRKNKIKPKTKYTKGIKTFFHPKKIHHPYVKTLQLRKIIAETKGVGDTTKTVKKIYDQAIKNFGNEMNILLKENLNNLKKILGDKIAEGIRKNRVGELQISPGYDGQYGKITIWGK